MSLRGKKCSYGVKEGEGHLPGTETSPCRVIKMRRSSGPLGRKLKWGSSAWGLRNVCAGRGKRRRGEAARYVSVGESPKGLEPGEGEKYRVSGRA